jgi:3-oxoacyl-[acyl-carrier protein] reductase
MSGVALSVENRVALITGGSRGIGAATVRLFREAGARVAFNYRTAQPQAEALVADCGGPKVCAAFAQELSTPEDGRALVRRTVEAFGRIDILVVNHGVWPAQDVGIGSMPDEQWRNTLAVNLDSVFGLIQAAAARMQEQNSTEGPRAGKAHIVLVSSTAGQRGEAFHADYAGIQVNCVAPGWVRTEMSAPALSDPATREKVFSVIPMGRVADPREIAGPILFLCTPLAGFMTGEIVNVNGGAVLVG